jgi:hypothetical protein
MAEKFIPRPSLNQTVEKQPVNGLYSLHVCVYVVRLTMAQ